MEQFAWYSFAPSTIWGLAFVGSAGGFPCALEPLEKVIKEALSRARYLVFIIIK
jgi:hypothetical protein